MPYQALAEYRERAQRFDFNGHSIAWWQAGQGDPLVLVHGFPSAAWDWHKIWPALTQRFTVTAFDMLGFGLSDKPYPHAYSMLEQADMITSLLQHTGIQACHVLAHDYGDSVTQELLTRAVEQRLSTDIRSVAFLNGGLFPESHRPLLTQKLLGGPFGSLVSRFISKRSLDKSFTRIFGQETPPSAEEIDVLWTLINEKQGKRVMAPLLDYLKERKVHRDRWVSAMQSSQIPLTFINGVEDPISGGHMLEQFRHLLPKHPTTALKAGHYPQLEVPEDVLDAFWAFHASLSSRE